MMGFNPNGNDKKREEEEDTKSISGASRIENLKHTDFRHIANMDAPVVIFRRMDRLRSIFPFLVASVFRFNRWLSCLTSC
jgi:hypothetical protein